MLLSVVAVRNLQWATTLNMAAKNEAVKEGLPIASIHEMPRRGLLGNWASGTGHSRKLSYERGIKHPEETTT